MDVFSQLRTSRGAVRVQDVIPEHADCACSLQQADAFRFIPIPPTRLAMGSLPPSAVESGRTGDGLIALATCAKKARGEVSIPKDVVYEFARKYGPLFGRSPVESLMSWGAAVQLADLAVTVQRVVNDPKMSTMLETTVGMQKEEVTNTTTGATFELYDVLRQCTPDYLAWLGGSQFIRREVTDERFNYAMMLTDPSEGVVEFFVASFKSEVTASDYHALCSALNLGEQAERDLRASLEIDDAEFEASSYDLGAGTSFTRAESSFDRSDISALSFLVRSIIFVHLRDAHVDPFQSDEATGYLSFNSLLSWLWFDFSKGLDTLQVAYCEKCGRAFSLVGHRGKKRRFCSQQCKTEAKNERMRKRRDDVRSGFMAGKSVRELADEFLGDEKDREEACERVRGYLRTWPSLKHELDRALAADGIQSELVRRCWVEQLGRRAFSDEAWKRLWAMTHKAGAGA